MSDEQVQVKFGAETQAVLVKLDELKNHIHQLGDEAPSAGDKFLELGKKLAEAFAVEKIIEFVHQIAEAGEQIERLQAMTGVSVETIQSLTFAMERTGGNADAAGQSITRLERNVEGAASGTGKAYEAFTKLGLSLQDIKTLSIDEILNRIAAGFKDISDPIERAALASEVGGRGFAAMLPALTANEEGLKAYRDRLVELNDNLSTGTVQALSETSHGFTDLHKAIQGAGVQAVLAFKGAIDGVIEQVTAAVVVIGKLIAAFSELQTIAGEYLVIAFAKLIERFEEIGAIGGNVADVISIKWHEVGNVIGDVLSRNFAQIKVDEDAAAEAVVAANTKMDTSLKQAETSYNATAAAAHRAATEIRTMGNAVNALDAALQKGSGGANRGGGAGSSAPDNTLALDDIKTEEQIAKANLATQLAILQQETTYHGISKQQEVEQEKQAVDAEYAINQAALQEKLGLYSQGSTAYEQVLNQMDVQYAQHTAKIAQLDAQMAKANQTASQQTYQSWISAVKPIETAFDGMLSGVLSGTETITQAMARAFDNMAISVIESIVKIVLEWLVFEAVTLGEGSWTDFMALNGKSSSNGPLGFLGSFDVGTNYVPSTGLAMIHQGEMVIPAGQADAIRSGGAGLGGGGSTVNVVFNVSAIDGQNAASFLRGQASTIAHIISTNIRNSNQAMTNSLRMA